MSNALSDAWQQAGAASVVSESLPQELRAWLAGWASGVEALSGVNPPRTIARPASWNTGSPSDTLPQAVDPEETLRQIRSWEGWYESAPGSGTHRVPLSVLAGEPSSGRLASWDELLTLARQGTNPQVRAAEVAYLTAARARWADALTRAEGAPFLARGRLRDAATTGEASERRSWAAHFDARAGATPPPGPPPPPPTARPNNNRKAIAVAGAFAGFLLAMAAGGKRRRR